jgi:hypothetical protein
MSTYVRRRGPRVAILVLILLVVLILLALLLRACTNNNPTPIGYPGHEQLDHRPADDYALDHADHSHLRDHADEQADDQPGAVPHLAAH